jgi:hypothetical protein
MEQLITEEKQSRTYKGTIQYEITIDKDDVLTMEISGDSLETKIVSCLVVDEIINGMTQSDSEVSVVIEERKKKNKPTKAFTDKWINQKDRVVINNAKSIMQLLLAAFMKTKSEE